MFREMRRRGQSLGEEECRRILEEGTHGVLALSGDDGYPYAVPISYALSGNCLIFHSAVFGHKIDSIHRSDKASFAVVECDDVVPEHYTTHYRSVIVFGRVRIAGDDEKFSAIRVLARRYAPDDTEKHREEYIRASWDHLAVLVMDIEHVSGKESGELAEMREKHCVRTGGMVSFPEEEV